MSVQQMRGSALVRVIVAAACVSFFVMPARAVITVEFDRGESDFINNFFVSRGAASQYSWHSGGWMRFANPSAAYSSRIFDTKVPPSGTPPLIAFGGGKEQEVYSIDFRVGHEKESAGISARIQGEGAGTNGYGVWLNTDDGGKAFHLYRLTSVHAGSSLVGTTLEPNLIVVDTWYTLTLTIRNVAGNVEVGASIRNRATGVPVGAGLAYTDTAANRVALAGRVGLRVQTGSSVTYTDFDNVSAAVIPDPLRGTLIVINSAGANPSGSGSNATVQITSPAAGTVYATNASIAITASASNPTGTIKQVDFYDGSVYLGADTGAPYSFTYNNPEAGTRLLVVRLRNDADQHVAQSAEVTVTVTGPPPAQPSAAIKMIYPFKSAILTEPFIEMAASTVGAVTNVEFFSGSTRVGADNSAPYTCLWAGMPIGAYTVTVRAALSGGGAIHSDPTPFTVTSARPEPMNDKQPGNQPPIVTDLLITPSQTVTSPAAITVSGNAWDPDGSIGKVEFFLAKLKMGERTTPTSGSNYACSFNVDVPGQYSIFVEADDNRTNRTSRSILLTVVPAASDGATVKPIGFRAEAVSRRQVNLSWRDDNLAESAYLLDRSTDPTFPSDTNKTVTFPTVGADLTVCADAGPARVNWGSSDAKPYAYPHDPPLEPGRYFYRLRVSRGGVKTAPVFGVADTSAFTPAGYVGSKTNFHLYLCLGQSNMAGRGDPEAGDLDPLSRGFLWNSADAAWEQATVPHNKYSTVRKEAWIQKLNPSYGFLKHMLAANSNVSIGLIVNARGGTRIEEWMKNAGTNTLYTEAVEQTTAAMRAGVLKGVIWHQGEGNADDGAYTQKLAQLIADLRADLGVPNLPFIAGQVNQSVRTYVVNAQIAALPTVVPYTGYASSTNPVVLCAQDQWHFDRANLLILGREYGVKMLEVQALLP